MIQKQPLGNSQDQHFVCLEQLFKRDSIASLGFFHPTAQQALFEHEGRGPGDNHFQFACLHKIYGGGRRFADTEVTAMWRGRILAWRAWIRLSVPSGQSS